MAKIRAYPRAWSGNREEPEIGIGLSFNETMSGWFSMGETDPEKGAETGRSQRSKLKLELTVLIDSLDRFLCDQDHTGLVRGKIILPRPFDRAIDAQRGIVKLFAPYQNTQRKSLLYELTFEYRGQNYHLAGEKLLEDDPGFDIWEDTTTLHTRLYERLDTNGKKIGAGIIKITLCRFLKEMLKVFIFKMPFNFRPFNAASFGESFQAIAVYLSFFAAELWDVYVRRVKGYFVKFMLLSSLTLGVFYLVHGWSIQAASEMRFMESMAAVSLSDWRPWYWPRALETIIGSYRKAYLQAPEILIFPLTLLIGLTLCRRDNGVHTLLGLGNFEFCPSVFTRFRGIVHAFAQLFVNLVLIWAFAKVNLSFFDLSADSVYQRLAFLIEMMVIGGMAGGFLYTLFRGVKLVRPYVG
jgi:hypothetical protein